MFQRGLPDKQGLYDPANEHDNCGIGFVANIKNRKSHDIVRQGLTILDNLTHRGAAGADPLTGDGAGILLQLPDRFFQEECQTLHINLPAEGDLRSLGLFPGEFFVRSVEADSPAAGVGMQVGDMLVAVDGRECAAWDACAAAMLERADRPHEIAFISAAHPELGPQQRSLKIEVRKVIGEYKEEQQIAVFGAQNRPLTVLSEPIPNEARFSYA